MPLGISALAFYRVMGGGGGVVWVGRKCDANVVWASQNLTARLLELANGIGQMQQFGVHLWNERFQFVHRVQDLNAFGVWVEAHLEWTRHGRHPATEFLLGIFEALRHVVDGLVFLVLVRLYGRGGWLEWTQFRFFAECVQQFTVRRQQTSAVGFDIVTTGFLAQTEFNGEPVNLRQE